MDDEMRSAPTSGPIALETAVSRNKTLRVKLATSLRSNAELVARTQGVSLNYLVSKAVEEKIARFRQAREARHGSTDGVHLVDGFRKSG
jgi:hypothetical protein